MRDSSEGRDFLVGSWVVRQKHQLLPRVGRRCGRVLEGAWIKEGGLPWGCHPVSLGGASGCF